ncbi:MAG: acyl-[ACP]--phospholipid O-acyltransferase [Rhodospirillales bacterium]|nr:MAG: acyl-[ACP]--phospholipid O-acyltransferase [Rhodospirillales bacterium]
MSDHSQFHLLRSRRFLPLFAAQFLGAFNDNAYRFALVLLVTFNAALAAEIDSRVVVTASAGIFILPFFLFSAIAGQMADRFEKSRLIFYVKLFEIVVMGAAALAFFLGNVWLLLAILFLMGTQSAFFGPLKYGILPDLLSEDELVGGNALVETGTFLAILLGTVFGGLLINGENGLALVSAALVTIAAIGAAMSLLIPRAGPAAPELRLNPNILGETWSILRHAKGNVSVFRSIVGISWFWSVGAVFLAQFPSFGKDLLGADEAVVNLFLLAFSVGIGIGSLQCNRWLDGEVSARYVPLGAIGMAAFGIMLYYLARDIAPADPAAAPIGIGAFLSTPANLAILATLVMIAVCGGLFIVPLYAILQARSAEAHRARNIAANNIMNAAFMVVAAAVSAAMLSASFSVVDVFLALSVGNVVAAFYITLLLPQEVAKALGRVLLRWLYKAEVHGAENVRKAGPRVVIVANHTSFLDGIVITCFLPGKPVFAINSFIAKRWWVRPAFLLFDLLPLDPTNPMAAKKLVEAVRNGQPCVIFPEGRITVTGALMKVYEGPGAIADMADATILPLRISGARFSVFSRLRGKLRLRWFPKITLTILEPRRIAVRDGLRGRARRDALADWLYDVMSESIFQTGFRRQTLFAALLEAREKHGGDAVVLEDIEREPLTYTKLVASSLLLGRHLARLAPPCAAIGLMMPNTNAGALAFFGMQAYRRVPAMLNYTAGVESILAACRAARVETVVTSRQFVRAAGLRDVVKALKAHVEIVWLEDFRRRIGRLSRLAALCAVPFAGWLHRRLASGCTPHDAAVVLFTSGSEGEPKGVVLSHENLEANRHQLSARIDFNPTDTVFNALPIFHAFGLTGALLLPLLSGVRVFLYPNPLHYRVVPELVYDRNATILFGTDTFLAGYAKAAHPYDFYSVRYVFAGAEKVKDETRRIWSDRFGLRILEGYGATECAPAIATNTPMHYRAGTVGRFLPGIRHRLVPVPGIDAGARLEVSGPNVMLGHLTPDRPGELQPPPDGWYDTGDIVAVDEDGYITIVGRARRFAKIAGEMVSLTAVETQAAALWPNSKHAAVALPDARKGERIILVTDAPRARRDVILAHVQVNGGSELCVPRDVVTVDAIPVLGSGKTDYPAVERLAAERTAVRA